MIVLRSFDKLRTQDERVRWVHRLTERARLLAEAHAESRLRARRGDHSRWRRAVLLWPLFAKDR